MRIGHFSFGSIQIDGETYEHDLVIDRGEIKKRKKKPSRKFRDKFGHTPLSIEEKGGKHESLAEVLCFSRHLRRPQPIFLVLTLDSLRLLHLNIEL